MTTALHSEPETHSTLLSRLAEPEEARRFELPPPGFRPRLQRVVLAEALAGTLGGEKARVIDISLSGALVAHQFRAGKGTILRLVFDWRGDPVHADCEVMRESLHAPPVKPGSSPIYRSGVAFRRFLGESENNLRQMIGDLVSRALDERKANARGIPPVVASSTQKGGRNRGYLTFVFVHGVWQRTESVDPIQPPDGFTVSIDEDPGQITLLCETYERVGSSYRKMIQDMARLSIANQNGIPTRRYEP